MLVFPLSTATEDNFAISIFDVVYNCKQQWNTSGKFWTLSFSDRVSNPVVQGVPIVAGLDILEQYPAIPFILRVVKGAELTRDNLADIIVEIIAK